MDNCCRAPTHSRTSAYGAGFRAGVVDYRGESPLIASCPFIGWRRYLARRAWHRGYRSGQAWAAAPHIYRLTLLSLFKAIGA